MVPQTGPLCLCVSQLAAQVRGRSHPDETHRAGDVTPTDDVTERHVTRGLAALPDGDLRQPAGNGAGTSGIAEISTVSDIEAEEKHIGACAARPSAGCCGVTAGHSDSWHVSPCKLHLASFTWSRQSRKC